MPPTAPPITAPTTGTGMSACPIRVPVVAPVTLLAPVTSRFLTVLWYSFSSILFSSRSLRRLLRSLFTDIPSTIAGSAPTARTPPIPVLMIACPPRDINFAAVPAPVDKSGGSPPPVGRRSGGIFANNTPPAFWSFVAAPTILLPILVVGRFAAVPPPVGRGSGGIFANNSPPAFWRFVAAPTIPSVTWLYAIGISFAARVATFKTVRPTYFAVSRVPVLTTSKLISSVTIWAALLTWSEDDLPVLHHMAKCSQLLVKGLYLLSPILLRAFSTTVSARLQHSCSIRYTMVTSLNRYVCLTTLAIPGFFGRQRLSSKNPEAVLEYSIRQNSLLLLLTSSTIAWCQ